MIETIFNFAKENVALTAGSVAAVGAAAVTYSKTGSIKGALGTGMMAGGVTAVLAQSASTAPLLTAASAAGVIGGSVLAAAGVVEFVVSEMNKTIPTNATVE